MPILILIDFLFEQRVRIARRLGFVRKYCTYHLDPQVVVNNHAKQVPMNN